MGLIHVETVDEAIALINQGHYGNMACLFTNSGPAARKFRYEADAGNIGINVGVAAPRALFPFSGWKDSSFGDLHRQSMDAIEFFTQKKGRRRALAQRVVAQVLRRPVRTGGDLGRVQKH